MIVSELVAILGFDVRGEGELRKFNQGLDRAEHSARGFSTTMVALGGAIAGALAGLQLGRMTGEFVASITNTGAAFEEMGVRLKALEGSSEGAEKALDWITDFATRTPLELAEVVDSYALMRTYGLDPTNGALQAVTDSMAATGGGAAKLNGVITGLGQAWTKQKLQGEEIMQLLERGIPVWDMLAKATGKSVPELQKLSSAGKLGRKEIALLIDQIGAKYQGASEEYAKTFAGITSNLKDNWTKFLKDIADAGYYDDVKRRLQGLLDFVNRGWESGAFKNVASGISSALIGTMDTASHLAMQAYRIGRGFYYAADGVVTLIARLNGLGKTTTAIGLGAGLLATSTMGRRAMMAVARRVPMVATLLVLDDILAGLNGDKSVVGSLEGGQAALDGIKASFKEVVVAANELAGTMNGIFGWNNLAGEDQLDTLMRSLKEYLAADAVEAFRGIGQMIRDVATALKAIDGVLKDPEAAWERFVTAAIAQLDRLVAAIDNELGGALTRFGFIGATAKENPGAGKVATTGKTTRAPSSSGGSTGMVDLVRSGMQTVEGMKAEYGLSETAIMKVALSLTEFMPKADQALAIQADLSRGVNAVATLNIDQFMANAERAQARLDALRASAGGASGAVDPRAGVSRSPGGR